MDTREKIVPLEIAAQRVGAAEWLVVVGRFDPLTHAHALRLRELSARGKALLLVVEPGADALLPAEARATLVAALRCVRLVAIGDLTSACETLRAEIVMDETRPDEFVEFVRARQRAAI